MRHHAAASCRLLRAASLRAGLVPTPPLPTPPLPPPPLMVRRAALVADAGVYDYLSHARATRAQLGAQGDAPLMGLRGTPSGRGWPESWRSEAEMGARKAMRKTREVRPRCTSSTRLPAVPAGRP